MCVLLPLWIISMIVVGIINIINIAERGNGEVKGYNIIVGLYSFPITIVAGLIYGIVYLFTKSRFKEKFQKTWFRL